MQVSIRQNLCIFQTKWHLNVLPNPNIPHVVTGGCAGVFLEGGRGVVEGVGAGKKSI